MLQLSTVTFSTASHFIAVMFFIIHCHVCYYEDIFIPLTYLNILNYITISNIAGPSKFSDTTKGSVQYYYSF